MSGSSKAWSVLLLQNRSQSLPYATLFGWLIIGLASFFIVLLLVVPLVALLWRALPGWMAGTWQTPLIFSALRLSLLTSSLALCFSILVGTPMAYVLARYRTFSTSLLDVLIDLPMILPPAVAGIALLVAFGRNGLIGQYLTIFGLEIPFTTTAVVMAQVFVSSPFFIKAAKSGFADVGPRLEQISATLGESTIGTFRRVTLPLARKALVGGGHYELVSGLGRVWGYHFVCRQLFR